MDKEDNKNTEIFSISMLERENERLSKEIDLIYDKIRVNVDTIEYLKNKNSLA